MGRLRRFVPALILAGALGAFIWGETGPHNWTLRHFELLSNALGAGWLLMAFAALVLALRKRQTPLTCLAMGVSGKAAGVVIGSLLSWRWAPDLDQGAVLASGGPDWFFGATLTSYLVSDLALRVGLVAAILAYGRANGQLRGWAKGALLSAAVLTTGMIMLSVFMIWWRLWTTGSFWVFSPLASGEWTRLWALASLAILTAFWVGLVTATIVVRDRHSVRAITWLLVAECALGTAEQAAAWEVSVRGWPVLLLSATVLGGLALCLWSTPATVRSEPLA